MSDAPTPAEPARAKRPYKRRVRIEDGASNPSEDPVPAAPEPVAAPAPEPAESSSEPAAAPEIVEAQVKRPRQRTRVTRGASHPDAPSEEHAEHYRQQTESILRQRQAEAISHDMAPANKGETVAKLRAQCVMALEQYDATVRGNYTGFVRIDPSELNDVNVLREYLKQIKKQTVLGRDGAKAFNNMQMLAKGYSTLNEAVPMTRLLFDARGLPRALDKNREAYVQDLGELAQDYPEITMMQGPEVRLTARLLEDLAATHAANKAIEKKREIQKN